MARRPWLRYAKRSAEAKKGDAGGDPQTFTVMPDGRGNVAALIDGSGAVVASFVYDAWGNLRLDLGELCDDLIRYCPDLLAGDFAPIRREGYHELAAYIKCRMPVVLNMPANDPIKAKFWQGDFTWARDLQEREQRGG